MKMINMIYKNLVIIGILVFLVLITSSISVLGQDKQVKIQLQGNSLTMVSLPLQISKSSLSINDCQISLIAGYTPMDGWYVAVVEPVNNKETIVTALSKSGRGFFVFNKGPSCYITYQGEQITQKVQMPLTKGWNLIGSGAIFSSECTLHDEIFYDLDTTTKGYKKADTATLLNTGFETGKAYWVYVDNDCKLITDFLSSEGLIINGIHVTPKSGPVGTSFTITTILTDPPRAKEIMAYVKSSDREVSDIKDIIAAPILQDDGQHNDSMAGDGISGGLFSSMSFKDGTYYIDLIVRDEQDNIRRARNVATFIVTQKPNDIFDVYILPISYDNYDSFKTRTDKMTEYFLTYSPFSECQSRVDFIVPDEEKFNSAKNFEECKAKSDGDAHKNVPKCAEKLYPGWKAETLVGIVEKDIDANIRGSAAPRAAIWLQDKVQTVFVDGGRPEYNGDTSGEDTFLHEIGHGFGACEEYSSLVWKSQNEWYNERGKYCQNSNPADKPRMKVTPNKEETAALSKDNVCTTTVSGDECGESLFGLKLCYSCGSVSMGDETKRTVYGGLGHLRLGLSSDFYNNMAKIVNEKFGCNAKTNNPLNKEPLSVKNVVVSVQDGEKLITLDKATFKPKDKIQLKHILESEVCTWEFYWGDSTLKREPYSAYDIGTEFGNEIIRTSEGKDIYFTKSCPKTAELEIPEGNMYSLGRNFPKSLQIYLATKQPDKYEVYKKDIPYITALMCPDDFVTTCTNECKDNVCNRCLPNCDEHISKLPQGATDQFDIGEDYLTHNYKEEIDNLEASFKPSFKVSYNDCVPGGEGLRFSGDLKSAEWEMSVDPSSTSAKLTLRKDSFGGVVSGGTEKMFCNIFVDDKKINNSFIEIPARSPCWTFEHTITEKSILEDGKIKIKIEGNTDEGCPDTPSTCECRLTYAWVYSNK